MVRARVMQRATLPPSRATKASTLVPRTTGRDVRRKSTTTIPTVTRAPLPSTTATEPVRRPRLRWQLPVRVTVVPCHHVICARGRCGSCCCPRPEARLETSCGICVAAARGIRPVRRLLFLSRRVAWCVRWRRVVVIVAVTAPTITASVASTAVRQASRCWVGVEESVDD